MDGKGRMKGGKSPNLTDEQNDLCYEIQFELIRAILKIDHDSLFGMVQKAIKTEKEDGQAMIEVAEKVTGRWIFEGDSATTPVRVYRCSLCGRGVMLLPENKGLLTEYPYCHCGAKMALDNSTTKEDET